MEEYHASGKLLLFGEYLVLKGGKALALPLKYGQKMSVIPHKSGEFNWVSTVQEVEWFAALFSQELQLISTSDQKVAASLLLLLQRIQGENPALFSNGWNIRMEADFPLEWGFGTSSTLISLLAQWSKTDPYELLKNSFGGSGYDVACATAHSPIIFEKENHTVQEIELEESVTSNLLFVYSGKKQKSKKEVLRFENIEVSERQITEMNKIILSAIGCKEIKDFELLIDQSEEMLAQILALEPIKNSTFSDYGCSIKSLGAWGGDFFMASFRNENKAREYFSSRGYGVQFTYDQIIKK